MREQIRKLHRIHVVRIKPDRLHLKVGQQRRLNVFAKLVCYALRFARIRNDEGFTHSRFGHTLNQVAVDGSADAESKHVAVIQVLSDVLKDTVLAIDVAIGHQHDTARKSRLARNAHRLLHRAQQFGAAAAALLLDQTDRPFDVFRICLQRFRRQHR